MNAPSSKRELIAMGDVSPLVSVLRIECRRRFDSIPNELKSVKGWVCWRVTQVEPVKGKFNKVPVYPATGQNRRGTQGGPEDLQALGMFDEAVRAFDEDPAMAGIGLAMLPAFGIVALDVDRCIEGDELRADAQVLTAETYCEVSPSGTGIRAFWRGTARDGKDHERGFELFHSKGFVTITGNVVPNLHSIMGTGALPLLDAATRYRLETLSSKTQSPDESPVAPLVAVPTMGHEAIDWPVIESAVAAINPDCSREEWIKVGMALHSHGTQVGQIDHAFTVWDNWSRNSESKYPGSRDLAQQWHSFRDDKATTVTMGSVFKLARDAGWTRPQADASGLFSATTWDSSKSREDEPRYKLLGSADLAAMPALAWRVRGVLPAVGLAGLYGPSASGKSFLGFDMAAAIADGARWFGCRVDAASVVYAALEGEAGFKLRVQAWEAHQGRKLPEGLHMVLQPFKLTEPHDVRDLAAVVPAGAVVFLDTLNRAAPTADENSSRDMGEILEAAKRLQTMTGGLVVLIHHTGKDATKGLRGHSSLFAALDAAVEVSRTGDRREWMVAKSKDGQDGDAHPFKLQVETLGLDDHGDLMTSCVVVPDAVARAVRAVKLPQGGNQKLVFDALRPMFNDGATGKPGAPPLRPCIELEAAIAKGAGHLTCEASRRSTRAREAITGLVAREVMGLSEGWLWLTG